MTPLWNNTGDDSLSDGVSSPSALQHSDEDGLLSKIEIWAPLVLMILVCSIAIICYKSRGRWRGVPAVEYTECSQVISHRKQDNDDDSNYVLEELPVLKQSFIGNATSAVCSEYDSSLVLPSSGSRKSAASLLPTSTSDTLSCGSKPYGRKAASSVLVPRTVPPSPMLTSISESFSATSPTSGSRKSAASLLPTSTSDTLSCGSKPYGRKAASSVLVPRTVPPSPMLTSISESFSATSPIGKGNRHVGSIGVPSPPRPYNLLRTPSTPQTSAFLSREATRSRADTLKSCLHHPPLVASPLQQSLVSSSPSVSHSLPDSFGEPPENLEL